MIVATRRPRFDPRLGPHRLQPMRPFQSPDSRRIQFIQQRLEHFPMRHAVSAVQTFESVEDQNQPLDVPPIQHAVLAIQRMRHRVRDPILPHVPRHRVDIVCGSLQRIMIDRRDAPDQQMNLAAVLREIAGQFLPDQHVRHSRKLRHSGNRIVIRDGHEIHPPLLGLGVDFPRFAVAFRTPDRLQHRLVRLGAGAAVAVKIDSFREIHLCS